MLAALPQVQLNMVDADGCTVLHMAVEDGAWAIVRILLAKGCCRFALNAHNETAVDVALGQLAIVSTLASTLYAGPHTLEEADAHSALRDVSASPSRGLTTGVADAIESTRVPCTRWCTPHASTRTIVKGQAVIAKCNGTTETNANGGAAPQGCGWLK